MNIFWAPSSIASSLCTVGSKGIYQINCCDSVTTIKIVSKLLTI